MAVQYLRKRVTGHTQHLGRFGDIQTERIQAALLDAAARVGSVVSYHGQSSSYCALSRGEQFLTVASCHITVSGCYSTVF